MTMKLILPRSQTSRIKAALRRAGRREIGGILMAEQTAPGEFIVSDFSIDEISGTEAHFVRSPEAAQKALDEFFKKTNFDYKRFNYLGEWHSHPGFPALPSGTDVRSMIDLVNGERDISFAALLIVKLKFWRKIEMTSFMFSRNSSLAEQINLIQK
ncbi:MAG: Mov34/MPN/PAD-1 family protein [Alphaproteobacteria bacterium]